MPWLATTPPEGVQQRVPIAWDARDGRRIEDDRLPRGQAARAEYAQQVGADGAWLLSQVAAPDTPEALQQLSAMSVLQMCWQQEDVPGADGTLEWRDPQACPVASERLESPDAPEARLATRRQLQGVGDKAHLRETCDDDLPHLVTQVTTTTIAPATAVAQLAGIQEALAARRLLPSEQVVDAASVRALNLVQSRERYQIDLVGPVETDHRWQARVEGGFTTECFALDWEAREAVCPRGQRSIRWCQTYTARQRHMIHIDFDPAHCRPCPDRVRCTRAKTAGGARTLTLQPRAEFEALVAGRARQQTREFAQRYARRAGIEGTFSQGVRALGMRRARYRGLRKTHLQQVATATALNLRRLADWHSGTPRAATRYSRFARLAPAS